MNNTIKQIKSELALVYLHFSLLTPSFAQVIRNIYGNLLSEYDITGIKRKSAVTSFILQRGLSPDFRSQVTVKISTKTQGFAVI